MRTRARADCARPWRKLLAYTKVYKWPVEGVFAEIHFCSKHLTLEIIAHEATHAAVGLAQIKRFDGELVDDGSTNTSAGEERLATIVGALTERIALELSNDQH
jgi:hypothetical protein